MKHFGSRQYLIDNFVEVQKVLQFFWLLWTVSAIKH